MKRVHETQSHATLALSSAYADSAARLSHLSIIRTQLLLHLTMHHPIFNHCDVISLQMLSNSVK